MQPAMMFQMANRVTMYNCKRKRVLKFSLRWLSFSLKSKVLPVPTDPSQQFIELSRSRRVSINDAGSGKLGDVIAIVIHSFPFAVPLLPFLIIFVVNLPLPLPAWIGMQHWSFEYSFIPPTLFSAVYNVVRPSYVSLTSTPASMAVLARCSTFDIWEESWSERD